MPPLVKQVNLFASATGGRAPSSGLYSVWIGSNDLYDIVGNGILPVSQALADAAAAAGAETASIGRLTSLGARDFIVGLVPDLGQTPELTSSGAAASALGTAVSAAYNAALLSGLQDLQAGTGITVAVLDAYSLLDTAIADPSGYGFTNTTDPCFTGTEISDGTVCANPDQYLFWDSVHPTAAGQALIAAAAETAIPEPAALAVLGFSLAGLAMVRRRQPALLRVRHA